MYYITSLHTPEPQPQHTVITPSSNNSHHLSTPLWLMYCITVHTLEPQPHTVITHSHYTHSHHTQSSHTHTVITPFSYVGQCLFAPLWLMYCITVHTLELQPHTVITHTVITPFSYVGYHLSTPPGSGSCTAIPCAWTERCLPLTALRPCSGGCLTANIPSG